MAADPNELRFEIKRARDSGQWEWWIDTDPHLNLGISAFDWDTPEEAAADARAFAARCCLKPVITMPR